MPGSIFDSTYDMLGKALDISSRRHNLITTNIANVDTIGYAPKDIDFKETLQKVMGKTEPPPRLSATHRKHFEFGIPQKEKDADWDWVKLENPYDKGHVNIDTEMVNLTENNIKYRSSIEMLLRKIGILKYSITEGGR